MKTKLTTLVVVVLLVAGCAGVERRDVRDVPAVDRDAWLFLTELDRLVQEHRVRFGNADEIPRPAHWGGWRLVPDEFEFWQGRRDRMHDRFSYLPADDGWRIEPPVSVPVAAGASRAATAAADPPEEPPGTRAVSQGLRVGP